MIGIVLAAGAGRRLRPVTDNLPKALAPVFGDDTILDFTLRNLSQIGLTDIVIVVGYAARAVEARREELQEAHGLQLELVVNDRAEEWNNAYSMWCARDHFGDGFILANGDTLHPVEVERTLLAGSAPGVLLALDDLRSLGEEQMKVRVGATGQVERITKGMPVEQAAGEYIGVSLVSPDSHGELERALRDTWQADPHDYYEDAYELLARRGHPVRVAAIGDRPWTEVDDHADLARAREIACLLS